MNYHVQQIKREEARPWILTKHYAHRMPSVSYAFGLYRGAELIGVCTFGSSANRATKTMIDGFDTIELNRLIINESPKNVLSLFVSQCLRQLPSPLVVVSYADPGQGHQGYIYQATNFVYTGQGTRKDGGIDAGVTQFEKNGKNYHAKSVTELIGSASKEIAERHGFKRLFLPPKHRYFYFIGSKTQKKAMRKALRYPVLPYPKGESKRYDAKGAVPTQQLLFT
jgi:hypothetical protein